MAPLSEAYLPLGSDGQQGSPARSVPKKAVAAFSATGLLSAVAIFYGGAEFGRTTPQEHAAVAVALPGNGSYTGMPTAMAAGLNPDCYTFTGGTCLVEPCNGWRHASCEDHHCRCIGGCAGADGKCWPGRNLEVATGFTLKNKKYNWQKLYMPATQLLDHLKTTSAPSWLNAGRDKFILHQLPGSVAGHIDYFLTTKAFPNYVAAIRATTGTAFSLFGAYEMSLAKEFSPERLAVRVCSLGDGQVMIGSGGGRETQWFYIHHGSWFVYGWGHGNPGPSGVWTTDPPIPDGKLPRCP